MKRIILLGFLLILYPSISYSAPLADCVYATVSSAVSSASAGDTVELPSCTETWTSTLTIDKGITLKGQGYASTVITMNGTAVKLDEANSARITGIGFVLNSGDVQIDVAGGVGWRIDHCQFTNTSGVSKMSISINGVNVSSTPAGLIDNSDFVEGRIVVDRGSNWTEYGTLWSTAYNYGSADSGGASNVYIEDNTFYKTVSGGGNVIDANRAGAYVARYNAITGNTQFQVHSLQASTERGSYAWEVYGNSFAATDSPFAWLFFRAGTGFIFNNAISGDYDYGPVFDNFRSYTEVSGTAGKCDGDSVWDGNTLANGWPCRDQIGRGTDPSAWNVGDAFAQDSKPAYVWTNIKSSANAQAYIHNDCDTWIQSDRDFYQAPTSYATFNGASGVGCGALASRPATCTTGVGYWATDQSCSDLTGMVGVDPATPISGTLYKCTATNTWTAYYTPYIYPHPLRNEGGVTYYTLTITQPTNGTITNADNTIVCGSGGSLCSKSCLSSASEVLTFTADDGYYMSAITGCSSSPCTLAMSEARAVTATFTNGRVATIGTGGTVTIGTGGTVTLQ